MNNQTSRLHQPNQLNCITFFTLAALLVSTFTLSGCASSALERERARNVLIKQEALLDSVKAERAVPEIATRVSKDATLAAAESRLNAALEALKKSNEAMQNTFSK